MKTPDFIAAEYGVVAPPIGMIERYRTKRVSACQPNSVPKLKAIGERVQLTKALDRSRVIGLTLRIHFVAPDLHHRNGNTVVSIDQNGRVHTKSLRWRGGMI